MVKQFEAEHPASFLASLMQLRATPTYILLCILKNCE